ncbi:hypothetical protein ACWD25_31345 [Streptomyces sp. NPDC002920]
MTDIVRTALLDDLGHVPWPEIQDTTGSAAAIPSLLTAVARGDADTAGRALGQLRRRICRYGFVVDQATAATVPFLWELVRLPQVTCRVEILRLLKSIADARQWETTAAAYPKLLSHPGDHVAWEREAPWNQGRLGSYLIEITAEVLAHTDATTGLAFVDIVTDAAGQKGTGRWTVQTALDLGSPVTAIAQATFARAASGQRELRAAYAGLPGGTTPPLSRTEAARFTSQVEHALYASKVIAYDQGWKMIQDAAAEFGWKIDLGAVAKIWRGGCIIRATFLDRIRAAYAADPELVSLLGEMEFAMEITDAQVPWRETVASAARRGIPVPAFSAALAHYDTLRAGRLPAALLQGQRDYFGAHTYGRTDRPGAFHTHWAEPGRPETSA